MLRRLVLEYRRVCWALLRYYRRRGRRRLTPEQEAERLIERLHRQQDFARRYGRH